MSDSHPRPPIVVTHETGVRFAAQIRSHRITVDQPRKGGGDDTAPAPIELLGASLGTCVAYYVQQFCESRGLPYEGMRIEVNTQGATNPHRLSRFDVRVLLPEPLPEQYAVMVERVARSCPAHNTLVHGAEVTVDVIAPASATVPGDFSLPSSPTQV